MNSKFQHLNEYLNMNSLSPAFACPMFWLLFINIYLAHIATIEVFWSGKDFRTKY